MLTTRRGFLQLIGVVAAGAYVEPERLVTVFDMARVEAVRAERMRPEMLGFGAEWRSGSMTRQWFAAGGILTAKVRRHSRRWGHLINADA